MPDEFLHKVSGYIDSEGLIKPGDRILAAVSGGVDSIVLMEVLNSLKEKFGFRLGIAHFNHKLRQEESERDFEFVRSASISLNLDFFHDFWRLEDMPARGSIQAEAREARHKFFKDIMSKHDFNTIALGHNRNDNIETIFMSLMKGYGLYGTRGIIPKNGNRIHPLLFATREEITSYAESEKLQWVEDSSNKENKYLRNKIRLEILPGLKSVFPGIEAALLNFGEESEQMLTWLEKEADNLWKSNLIKTENSVLILEINTFLQYFSMLRKYFLRKIIGHLSSDISPSQGALQNIEGLCFTESGRRVFVGNIEILNNRGNLIFGIRKAREVESFPEIGESCFFKDYILNLDSIDPGEVKLLSDASVEYIDRETVKGRLKVRSWKKGDTFVPFGMSGKMKVSDFLINRKISRFEKDNLMVLCDDEKIVWICGRRLDDRVKITPTSKQILRLSVRIKKTI